MPEEDLRTLVLLTVTLFVGITGFIIYFIVLYRNRQIRNIQEQQALQSAFKQEMLKAQIEMQEQTLLHISREIHDNITQVLSFVKLNLALINKAEGEQKQAKVNESRELVSRAITDLRDLSKSLSFEHIVQHGLLKTIEAETNRINKTGIIQVELLTEGKSFSLGEQRELVLFRIFQEALNNTLKHSGAKHLNIRLQYIPEMFNLTLADDGGGFPADLINTSMGSGLRNIENRAALIGAKAKIESSPGQGCSIKISLNPLEQHIYTNGYHPDRLG
jgi:signal transduction histidine kinase